MLLQCLKLSQLSIASIVSANKDCSCRRMLPVAGEKLAAAYCGMLSEMVKVQDGGLMKVGKPLKCPVSKFNRLY